MGAVKDLYYDVESMFIEGLSAREISKALNVPLESVQDILDDFGVDAEDQEVEVDAEDWDELEAFDTDDF
jgi:hypothetical protein